MFTVPFCERNRSTTEGKTLTTFFTVPFCGGNQSTTQDKTLAFFFSLYRFAQDINLVFFHSTVFGGYRSTTQIKTPAIFLQYRFANEFDQLQKTCDCNGATTQDKTLITKKFIIHAS